MGESLYSFLGKVLNDAGNSFVLDVFDEVFGFLGVILEGVYYVAGNLAYVMDDIFGAEEAS